MGKLEVQENSGVSVSLPHNDGVNATNYKGQAKPASTKDCILIIDHETGELTLERLSNQVDNVPELVYCVFVSSYIKLIVVFLNRYCWKRPDQRSLISPREAVGAWVSSYPVTGAVNRPIPTSSSQSLRSLQPPHTRSSQSPRGRLPPPIRSRGSRISRGWVQEDPGHWHPGPQPPNRGQPRSSPPQCHPSTATEIARSCRGPGPEASQSPRTRTVAPQVIVTATQTLTRMRKVGTF